MKVAMICPFWLQPHHVGGFRVRRMVRWLLGQGAEVAIVTAGTAHAEYEENGVRVVCVRDPLLRHRSADSVRSEGIRSHSLVKRFLGKLSTNLLVPDLSALWKHAVLRDDRVRRLLRETDLVIASAPPESALTAARELAEIGDCRFVSDLRDGWLDEPLKSQLDGTCPLRAWVESRMERAVMRRSAAVIVTSEEWRSMLIRRFPEMASTIHVITNAVPDDIHPSTPCARRSAGRAAPTLLYAGRLGGSRRERSAGDLFRPLLMALEGMHLQGRICFLGERDEDEYAEICRYTGMFRAFGWDIEFQGSVERSMAVGLMRSADGLLLISGSIGSIPAKLFDYLAAGRPILAIAPRGSAVAGIAARYGQAYFVSIDQPDASTVRAFLSASASGLSAVDVPHEFSEQALAKVFSAVVQGVIAHS